MVTIKESDWREMTDVCHCPPIFCQYEYHYSCHDVVIHMPHMHNNECIIMKFSQFNPHDSWFPLPLAWMKGTIRWRRWFAASRIFNLIEKTNKTFINFFRKDQRFWNAWWISIRSCLLIDEMESVSNDVFYMFL